MHTTSLLDPSILLLDVLEDVTESPRLPLLTEPVAVDGVTLRPVVCRNRTSSLAWEMR